MLNGVVSSLTDPSANRRVAVVAEGVVFRENVTGLPGGVEVTAAAGGATVATGPELGAVADPEGEDGPPVASDASAVVEGPDDWARAKMGTERQTASRPTPTLTRNNDGLEGVSRVLDALPVALPVSLSVPRSFRGFVGIILTIEQPEQRHALAAQRSTH